MKPQQHPDLEIDGFDEEEEEDQDDHEFGQTYQHKQKYTALATLIALTVVLLLILLGLKIAASLEEIPKIYMEYQQEAHQPKREERNGRYIQLQQIKPSFEEMVSQVKIQASSPANMVQVQASNSIHRNYQQTMRKIQSENAHMQLDKHKNKQFSKLSSMTFQHYLQALDLLQLITFPPDQYSNQYGKLVNQERLYYNQRYDIRSTNIENSICVVLTLTREGLQNGGYYLALKSIFQQQYNNFKVVVIDNPEMRMLEDVQKLLRELGRSKMALLERVRNEEMTEASFFVEGAVGKYCKESAMTLLLRDTGQLIGREVFSVINKIYEQKQPEIIFTHYILEPFNPLRQSFETFRYKIQLYPQNLAQPRTGPYRTKYLKVYRTDLLLRLQDRVFQKSDGHWMKDLFEANLQFSMLELSCGKYHLINEIMYMATKYDIQTPVQVLDARKHERLSCYLQPPNQLKSQSTQLKVHP